VALPWRGFLVIKKKKSTLCALFFFFFLRILVSIYQSKLSAGDILEELLLTSVLAFSVYGISIIIFYV
jgi:hypothetical protein